MEWAKRAAQWTIPAAQGFALGAVLYRWSPMLLASLIVLLTLAQAAAWRSKGEQSRDHQSPAARQAELNH